MPDILTTIQRRRSVRKFKKSVPNAGSINKILEAGRWAPSGLNNQPWRFLVITKKDEREALAEFTKYGAILRNAPALLAVCMDIASSYNRDKDVMAIGACIQNMLLEASSLHLGACWLGEILNKKKEVAEHLKLDDDLELMAIVALGKPIQTKHKGCRKTVKDLMVSK